MRKGFVLNGRYQIIDRLGEGGMADVYLAKDLILDRLVAVKVLRLDFRDDKKAQERFRHEAMAATALDNPHIVGIYDVDEMDGMQYIAMEYIDGEDLKYYIKNHFPIPYAQVIDIMEQILSAVHEAHRHNIIHRDLKPQNVLIDKNGYAKITDFGISKAESENTMTQTRSIVGSIHYLSPEQIKGQVANQQSDIYSLGIILYEMLTGKVPFNGETAVSIAIKHSQTPIPAVRDFDPRIPQALENVVLKATTKDPQHRYDTVAQMADDLRTSLDQSRANEPKFIPELDDDGKTKVMPFAPMRPELVEAATKANETSNSQVADKSVNQPKTNKKNKGKKKHKWLWVVVTTIIALLGMTLILLARLGSKTSVPNLTNLTRQTAIKRLTQSDLAVGKVNYEASDEVEKNNVIKTNPQAGRSVKKKAKVNLIVSSGPKLIKLENYVGQNYKTVAAQLRNRGFTVKRRNTSSATFKSGKILQQDFKPGQSFDPNNKVLTFIVSTGIKQVTLDDLTGMTKEQVINYMNDNGINPVFDYVYSNIQAKGKVVKQSPGAGQTVQQGSSIMVYLSRGKQKTQAAISSFNIRIKIPFADSSTTTDQNKMTNTAYSHNESNTNLAASSSSTDSIDDVQSSMDSSSSVSENDQSDNNSKTNPAENIVLIYLKDHDHSFASVYKQMVITKDTNVILPFKLADNEVGKYKVVRDGKVILRDNNVTSNSN
ncbi:Stk1 family PASTA domain-containing Ser/Thr kinase [Lentilactobacillus senioris]|uniref:Stk1 family PASTA domain-containing Ser/Thr kinase n=1 Tax=Lentilactobacillus senioris TaxID=931534 RepID=UPI0022816202|nr:Stk1 family PASTA domain-containing Ser/Thr kinase [Lentilactobacillus senioris]